MQAPAGCHTDTTDPLLRAPSVRRGRLHALLARLPRLAIRCCRCLCRLPPRLLLCAPLGIQAAAWAAGARRCRPEDRQAWPRRCGACQRCRLVGLCCLLPLGRGGRRLRWRQHLLLRRWQHRRRQLVLLGNLQDGFVGGHALVLAGRPLDREVCGGRGAEDNRWLYRKTCGACMGISTGTQGPHLRICAEAADRPPSRISGPALPSPPPCPAPMAHPRRPAR